MVVLDGSQLEESCEGGAEGGCGESGSRRWGTRSIAYTLVKPLGSLVWRAHSAACTTMEEKGHTLVVSSAVVHASTLRISDGSLDGSCGEAVEQSEGKEGNVADDEQVSERSKTTRLTKRLCRREGERENCQEVGAMAIAV